MSRLNNHTGRFTVRRNSKVPVCRKAPRTKFEKGRAGLLCAKLMGAWLASALEAAHELAAGRGQVVSTAHLLLGLLRCEPSVAALCARLGVRQRALIPQLIALDERSYGVGEAIASAYKLAVAMSMRRTLPMHLLHVLVHQPRCAANTALVRLGVSPEALGQAALDALEVPPALPPPPRVAASPRPVAVARPARPVPPPRLPRLRLPVRETGYKDEPPHTNSSIWLGDEVEARLKQAGVQPPDRAPSTFADQVEAKLRRGR